MAKEAWHCWAEEELGRTEWRRWWMTGYCWSPVGKGQGCDPKKKTEERNVNGVFPLLGVFVTECLHLTPIVGVCESHQKFLD